MGSITGVVGQYGGIRIPPVNAPFPTLRPSQNWVITSLYDPTYQANWSVSGGYVYVPFEYGWRAFTFQLIPGTGSGNSVNVSGTNDPATAQNLVSLGGTWDTIPSAGGAPFANPILMNGSTPRLLYVNSGPWAAFRLQTGGAFPGSSGAYVLFGAAS